MSKKEDLEKKKKIQKLKEVEKAAVADGVATANRMIRQRDIDDEEQTIERYKNTGISPIYSKGRFTSYTKYNPSTSGITEDDKVPQKGGESNLTDKERTEAINKGIKLARKKK